LILLTICGKPPAGDETNVTTKRCQIEIINIIQDIINFENVGNFQHEDYYCLRNMTWCSLTDTNVSEESVVSMPFTLTKYENLNL
jgi:hypothetical protein